jgi:hypothetical protein
VSLCSYTIARSVECYIRSDIVFGSDKWGYTATFKASLGTVK